MSVCRHELGVQPPDISNPGGCVVFVGCEWLQVNKVRAQSQDPSRFDDKYVPSFILDL